MKLTIAERINAFSLLPEKGDVATLRTLQSLRSKLAFTETDLEFFGIKVQRAPQSGLVSYTWGPEASAHEFDIELTGGERRLVVEALQKLESSKELPLNCLSLWEKFVEPPESEASA